MVDAPTRPLARTALLTLVTALTVELVRASGPMFDRAFAAGVVIVALTALGTYVAPGLVALAVARLRPVTGRTVLVGVVLLALARLAVQATGSVPRYWIALGAASVAIGVLVLTVHLVAGDDGDPHRAPSRRAAIGVLTGVMLATGLSMALSTWDAVWRPGLDGWLPTVLVVGGALWCAWLLRDAAATTPPRRVWALGPYLALAVMVMGNPAYLASQLGRSLDDLVVPLTFGFIATSMWLSFVRVGAGRGLGRRGPALAPVLMAVVLVATSVAVFVPTQALGEPATGLGVVVALLAPLLLLVASTYALAVAWSVPLPARAPLRAGLARAGTATAVGLGLILPLLVYQLDYDVPLGFPNWLVVLAAVVALAAAGVRRPAPAPLDADGARFRLTRPAHLAAAAVAILVLVALPVRDAVAPPRVAPAIDKVAGTVRVLDWNLHYGVTQDPGLGLGRMAEAIRGTSAQVVTLQEVSRGWVMGGGADMLTYLERATGFRAVAAPAADRQFVNVLLVDPALLGSDGEFGAEEQVVRTRLPYGDGPQWRSAITATLSHVVPLVVTSAHLQHRDENTPTRLAQLDVLMAADIASQPAALIAGDFNSEPGWPEIDHVTSRGFVSAQDAVGDPSALTFPAWAPDVRIDWIFGRGMTFTGVHVMPDDGSDHRGIVADIELAPVEAAATS
ncbi:endonuclease/exonuclease/phosphatase family protein [Sanguibacter sp. HDW7]|uniref:endonuclease/exonuclease/phosphatase family protein n=1 Tax=Sanguibacter sp. HDW7 TaxID=2714931 RepID=UPI00140AF057|nr:endonuclease/exonuclease/phosphatase family protein [Sanguibacter sp. HDW7]QIK82947.1 endonuclease [Sanguibacter sp. HDW7]